MNEKSNRIRAVMKARGFTLATLAKLLNVTHQTVGHWVTGRNDLSQARLEQLAALLGVTPQWLQYGLENDKELRLTSMSNFIPLLETHQIKKWLETHRGSDFTMIDLKAITESYDSFALEVKGDGMVSPSHPEKVILPGEIVIIDTKCSPKSGEIVLVEADGDYKIRQYLLDGKEIYLVPFNPLFERKKLENTESIKGVIVQKIRYYHSPHFSSPLRNKGK